MIPFLMVSIGLFFGFCISRTQSEKEYISSGPGFSMPDNVKQILDNSCFPCHNTDSRNEKAKSKFNVEELGSLSVPKLVGKMGDIKDVLDKNEMPPKKFREMRPEKVPTPEQFQILKNWATATANSLIEQTDSIQKK
jgi:hypothetical protein